MIGQDSISFSRFRHHVASYNWYVLLVKWIVLCVLTQRSRWLTTRKYKSPGQMISLDTGDSNVYSVFRNSRYTVNFVCVVSFYRRVKVPLQGNSAPLFLKALEYAARVFQ